MNRQIFLGRFREIGYIDQISEKIPKSTLGRRARATLAGSCSDGQSLAYLPGHHSGKILAFFERAGKRSPDTIRHDGHGAAGGKQINAMLFKVGNIKGKCDPGNGLLDRFALNLNRIQFEPLDADLAGDDQITKLPLFVLVPLPEPIQAHPPLARAHFHRTGGPATPWRAKIQLGGVSRAAACALFLALEQYRASVGLA